MYLRENTQEVVVMREKINNLLLSKDEDNRELAFQLILGGGFHSDFLAPIVANLINFYVYKGYEYITEKYQYFLSYFENELSDVKRIIEDKLRYLNYQDLKKDIEFINEYDTLRGHWPSIASAIFKLTTFGGRNCFHHQLLPVSTIFDTLINGTNSLNLNAFDLDNLPAELAEVNVGVLELCDNPFESLQESWWVNPNIKRVILDLDLPKEKINKIVKHFPNAADSTYLYLADHLKSEGHYAQRANDMARAKEFSLKALEFYRYIPSEQRNKHYYHNRAHAYNNSEKYSMALKCYEHIIKKYPNNYDDCLYNMACTHSRLKDKTKMLQCLAIKLRKSNGQYVMNDVMSDNDFESFWEDNDLVLLLQARIDLNDEQYKEFTVKFF